MALRLSRRAALVGALCLAGMSGCGGAGAMHAGAPQPLPSDAIVAGLDVTLARELDDDDREQLARLDVPLLLRLAALDWFEHQGRFQTDGDTWLSVEVTGLSLRSELSAWLWPSLAGPDVLAVRVRVRDATGMQEAFDWQERTAVGGWDWRDADARLDRLARRLGRRIAELL